MKGDIEITLRLAEAYFSGNQILASDIAPFLRELHKCVKDVFYPEHSQELVQCRECGKTMATLRKHLRTQHGLTVEQYLSKHNLSEIHITSQAYSKKRQDLGKKKTLE